MSKDKRSCLRAALFQSDLQVIFGMLQYKEQKKSLCDYVNAHQEYFKSVDTETYHAIGELLHSTMKFENMLKTSVEKEKVNMCGALEELYNDGVSEGLERGILSGVNVFIKTCKEFGVTDQEILQRMQKEFSLSEERAKEYMEKYQF